MNHMDTATTAQRGALLVAGLTALTMAAALTLAALPSAADEPPPPISIEPLTGRHLFTDDITAQIKLKPSGRSQEVVNLRDASHMAVLEITVQPGARFPWHTHPGPVLVAVTQGELVYVYADDCVRRSYAAARSGGGLPATAFVDPGGANVHTAFNATDDETVVIATFLGAPPAGPLTLPVDAEQQAALDQRCGLAPGSAHSH